MRAHGLTQSTNLLMKAARDHGITIDCSTFLSIAESTQPFRHWIGENCSIVRVPFTWEDDFEMYRPRPCWKFEKIANQHSGVQIFNFHPIHVVLNCPNMDSYSLLKKRHSKIDSITSVEIDALKFTGLGPGSVFEAAAAYLSKMGGGRTIVELCETVCD